MKKLLLVIMTFMIVQSIYSQAGQDVVAAEKAFAQYAITHSTRQAFLQYLDSQGVVFNRGAVRNGIELWTAAPESSIKLLWQPAFAAMSAAGDLGFTTGPYELRQTMEDTAVGAGHYTTIWVKNKAGNGNSWPIWVRSISIRCTINRPSNWHQLLHPLRQLIPAYCLQKKSSSQII